MIKHTEHVAAGGMDSLTWMSEQGGDTLSCLVVEDGDVFIRAARGKESPWWVHLNLQAAENPTWLNTDISLL